MAASEQRTVMYSSRGLESYLESFDQRGMMNVRKVNDLAGLKHCPVFTCIETPHGTSLIVINLILYVSI